MPTAQAFIGNTLVRTEVTGEMADIGRRLIAGDPTLGWDGDPTLSLHMGVEVDPKTGNPLPQGKVRYEVWGLDLRGEPYCALTWPRCDASLIRRLVEIDNRRSSVWERSKKIAEQAKRDIATREADARGEKVEELAWALRRDLGHHHGGLRKTVH